MRGVTFTLEAVVTLLLLMAFASSFVTIRNLDHLQFYGAVAGDVASLAVSEGFWQMSDAEQIGKVEEWSFAAGPCVKLVKDGKEVKSSNCKSFASEMEVSVQRVYVDKNTGEISAFTVFIALPG